MTDLGSVLVDPDAVLKLTVHLNCPLDCTCVASLLCNISSEPEPLEKMQRRTFSGCLRLKWKTSCLLKTVSKVFFFFCIQILHQEQQQCRQEVSLESLR